MGIGPGFFTAALAHPDGLGRVYLVEPPNWRVVACEVAGLERWRLQGEFEAPDLLRDPWAAAAPDGRVMIAAQGGNTNQLTVGDVTPAGIATWTTWPVICRFGGVAWNGVGFVLFATVDDGATLLRIDLNSGFEQRSPIPVAGGTTLGYRRVVSGRDVNGSEDDILYSERPEGNGYVERVINGRTYRVPVEVEGLVIGLTNGRTEGVWLADNRRILVCEEETRDPRLVARNGQYLACGYLLGDRAFVTTEFPPIDDTEEPELSDPPVYAPLPRKLWFAPYYQFTDKYGGDTDDVIGNAAFTWEPGVHARIIAKGIPLIFGNPEAWQPAFADMTVAYYIERDRPRDAEDEYKRYLSSEFPEKPIIIYCDVKQYLEEDGCPDWVDRNRTWIGIHTYREPDEPLGAYESRMRGHLNFLTQEWRVPIMLAPQYFDRGAGLGMIPATLEMKAIEDRFFRDYFVVAIMPFADRRGDATQGGMAKYQVLRAWCQALYKAALPRPNRFDYWTPANTDWKTKILNVLMQDVGMYNLSVEDRQRLIALVKGTPPPPPPDDTIPDLSDIVDAQFAQHPDLVEANTQQSCGQLTEFIARDLNAADANFGLLSKQPGEKQYRGHGIDSIAYGRTNTRVLDVIVAAGSREDLANGVPGAKDVPAKPDWNEVPRRPGNEWMAPL